VSPILSKDKKIPRNHKGRVGFLFVFIDYITSPPQNQTVSVNQLHTECRRPARVNQVLTLSDPLITERGKVTHFKSNFQENLRVIDKQNCSFKEFSRLKKKKKPRVHSQMSSVTSVYIYEESE
jgi:alpha-L-fucosidase